MCDHAMLVGWLVIIHVFEQQWTVQRTVVKLSSQKESEWTVQYS